MDFEQISLVKNEEDHRFEMLVKEHFAFIKYVMINDHTIELYHTEVPHALEGQGVGKELVIRTLEYCRLNSFKVVATCPFIVAYLKRHPEWQDIILFSADN